MKRVWIVAIVFGLGACGQATEPAVQAEYVAEQEVRPTAEPESPKEVAPVVAEEEVAVPTPVEEASGNDAAAVVETVTEEEARGGDEKPAFATTLLESEGIHLTGMRIATGVEKREPLNAGTSFVLGQSEKMFAVLDVRNPGEADGEVFVSWKMPGRSEEVGRVGVTVRAQNRPFRTWSFTRWANRVGQYEALVRDGEGNLLATAQFEMLPADTE